VDVLLVCLTAALLGGCGGGSSRPKGAETFSKILSSGERVENVGGRLFVTDGCSACHKISGAAGIGPSLDSFVARTVKLRSGGEAKVNESFLRESLLDPRRTAIAGYPAGPMIEALGRRPVSASEAAALAAFIESVGPEIEPE
jgi:cytochrome c oxidase subunit 2